MSLTFFPTRLAILWFALPTAWAWSQDPTSPGWPQQKSNLYPSRLTDLPAKSADGPAQILNFVKPIGDDAPTRLPNGSLNLTVRPVNDQSESLDQLLLDASQSAPSTDEPTGLPLVSSGPQNSEVIRQRYPDGKIQVEREVVQDDRGNYQNHGSWKLYNRTGEVIAEGQFVRGRMEGPWKRLHAQNEPGIFANRPFDQFQGPFLSMATFRDGELEGVWQIYDRRQRKVMEVHYRQGQRDGGAYWWYPNGYKMREMSFRNGILDGKFTEWDTQNKVTREEDYIEGRKVSQDIAYYSRDQRRSESNFLEAKLIPDGKDDWWEAKPAGYRSEGLRVQHGPVLAWYENGQFEMRGQFNEGQRDGQFTFWHTNGQKKLLGFFEKDQRVGTWTWWHANGMKASEGRFAANQPVGQWISWDPAGRVEERKDFEGDEALELPQPRPINDEELPAKQEKPKPTEPPISNPDPGPPIQADSPEEIDLTPTTDGSKSSGSSDDQSGKSTFRIDRALDTSPWQPPRFAPASVTGKTPTGREGVATKPLTEPASVLTRPIPGNSNSKTPAPTLDLLDQLFESMGDPPSGGSRE